MSNLTFQYPAWFLLLCVLLGLGYAMLLYYRDTTFKEQSNRLNLPLGILRFLVVTIISALLLAPLLKTRITETKKPVVISLHRITPKVLGLNLFPQTSISTKPTGRLFGMPLNKTTKCTNWHLAMKCGKVLTLSSKTKSPTFQN